MDSATLYRDHADWHVRLLPKVQKLVLALAGSDRPGARAGNGDDSGDGDTAVPVGTAALARRRAVRSPRPPREEPPACVS